MTFSKKNKCSRIMTCLLYINKMQLESSIFNWIGIKSTDPLLWHTIAYFSHRQSLKDVLLTDFTST